MVGVGIRVVIAEGRVEPLLTYTSLGLNLDNEGGEMVGNFGRIVQEGGEE